MQDVPRARVKGPLAPFADEFRAELDRLGYTENTREYKINQVAGLSRWLDSHGLGVADITEARVEAFFTVFAAGRKRTPTVVAMGPLLGWLRRQGAIGPEATAAVSALDELMVRYRRWMVHDRGLADRTAGRYEQTARRFLSERVEMDAGCSIEELDTSAVTGFLLAEASRGLATKSLNSYVAGLRSLLRFLHVEGLTRTGLADAVPPVSTHWRDTTTPPTMSATTVQELLASCDRAAPAGARDFAMLTVIARLGLRAAEIAGLKLDDIDWRAGEVAVRGKGRRVDRLPLPADVGDALAGYLSGHRPKAESRAVFVTVVAPWRPLLPTAVSQMVWRQCVRSGVTPVRAHRLRHALASELLAQGVKLVDISQVLRHRDLATTAVYAKVDHRALRELALPWPEVTR